ncbi:Uncharacterized protein Rs2_48769 [Raphanus sativus]|nr:Uncharacterized protein Rs2_48769 [Raphanus sativus]
MECCKPIFVEPRSGGLVDYEDDEDDEDYKPPPRKQPEVSEEEEGELLGLKRKSLSQKENKSLPKKPRLDWVKTEKRKNVFAVLCPTLRAMQCLQRKVKAPLDLHPGLLLPGNLGNREVVKRIIAAVRMMRRIIRMMEFLVQNREHQTMERS